MTQTIQHTLIIPEDMAGLRLDQALAKLLPDYSRTQLQEWIKNGSVTIDTHKPKTRIRVLGGETIEVQAQLKEQPTFEAQAIALNVVYEDDALMIINKPVGLVVHPGSGNAHSTLLNALLHHAPALKDLPRAGIVHRLDKDTSGLLVIAKTPAALTHLSTQLKNRTISRIYQAIAGGIFTSGGKVDAPIARHAIQRKRMAIVETGKPAVTHFRVLERYRAHTRLKVQLETGRTHQIRVHMAHIQHPLLGDPVYGGRLQLPKGASPALIQALRSFKRQALHAIELTLEHPTTHETMTCNAPIPQDMQDLIETLRQDATLTDKNDYDI